MLDVILSIAIFHSLCALGLIVAVTLAALFGKRRPAPIRRLPVIARAHFAAPKAFPVPRADYDTLPAAA